MAIATTSQVLYDGPRRTKMQFTGVSDGSGELALVTLVNAAGLGPLGPGQPCRRLGVEKITGSVKPVGSVELYWDALTPVKFAELTGTPVDMDYRDITSIVAPPATGGLTGNILISTTGFVAGTTYMLEIEFIKKI